jgi:hypothetical protein
MEQVRHLQRDDAGTATEIKEPSRPVERERVC